MIHRWERGRPEIDRLLAETRLMRVTANRELADFYVAQAPARQDEFREFDWMRRLRNSTQYPDAETPVAAADDVAQALPAAHAIVDRAVVLLDHMPPY